MMINRIYRYFGMSSARSGTSQSIPSTTMPSLRRHCHHFSGFLCIFALYFGQSECHQNSFSTWLKVLELSTLLALSNIFFYEISYFRHGSRVSRIPSSPAMRICVSVLPQFDSCIVSEEGETSSFGKRQR